jgi:glutaredoxin
MPTTRRCREAARAAALCALALFLAPAAAQVYRWTDPQGKTHYGDKPPEEAKATAREVKITAKSYDGPPQIDDWAAIIRRPADATRSAGTPGQLTLYSATWCGPCKRAKAHLAKTGIPYRNVDIDDSDANKAEFRSYGGGGIPLFILGTKRMRGFSPESLDDFLARAKR